jgi:hypothetical protein
MAEDAPQFYRQFLRSQTETGQEIVREIVSPTLLDADQAKAAEAQAGRTFRGFVAPGDMNALGAQPQEPPPAQPSAAPGFGAQVRHTLLPERTFMSEVPSIVLGTAGAIGGGMTGPFAPVVAPALAAAGSGLGEAGQVGLEHVMGWPPAEPGTLGERVTRAATRGGVTEAAMLPLRALPYVAKGGKAVLGAAEELAPVLRQNLPEGAALLERGIAEIAPAAADQPTLLRAWWQEIAPKGPAAVTAAWDALGEAGQAALAGGQRAAMQTVVNTLRASGEAVPWGRLGTRSATLYGAGRMLGYPELGEVAAMVPGVVGVTRAVAPKVAAPLLLSPRGSQFLAALPSVGRVASPFVHGGAQVGAGIPGMWPGPVVYGEPGPP